MALKNGGTASGKTDSAGETVSGDAACDLARIREVTKSFSLFWTYRPQRDLRNLPATHLSISRWASSSQRFQRGSAPPDSSTSTGLTNMWEIAFLKTKHSWCSGASWPRCWDRSSPTSSSCSSSKSPTWYERLLLPLKIIRNINWYKFPAGRKEQAFFAWCWTNLVTN